MKTTVRRNILTILTRHHTPIPAPVLLRALKQRGLPVNKTTVYRQLAALQKKNVIREVRLNDRAVRYEMNEQDEHHHHLVCLRCGDISDVEFPNDLSREEQKIFRQKKFKVLRHSLEFFGWCRTCQ